MANCHGLFNNWETFLLPVITQCILFEMNIKCATNRHHRTNKGTLRGVHT